jgi:hypothetical protein
MTHQNYLDWTGKSGNVYRYYEISFNNVPFNIGNYMFVRQIGQTFYALYIGEGNIKERINDKEHLQCATKKGFTHIFAHENMYEQSRKFEENDLVQEHTECWVENGGCNATHNG